MGPVIMTIWAWLGWLWVERHSRPDPHIMTRVYVDDRSFGTSRIWSLHDRFHQWSSWSWSVGLQENQVKAVAVASTPARRTTLRRVLPDAVRNDMEILGSCSMVTRRGLLGKEAGRADACKRTLTLLSCVRLPFERYMRDCPCASFDLVHPFVEPSACWQSSSSACFCLASGCFVRWWHAFGYPLRYPVGWHSCALASAPDFDLVHSWRLAGVCFECLAPFSWLVV